MFGVHHMSFKSVATNEFYNVESMYECLGEER
jgi:hypothetical protein